MDFKNIKTKLSRDEMKNIMAGTAINPSDCYANNWRCADYSNPDYPPAQGICGYSYAQARCICYGGPNPLQPC